MNVHCRACYLTCPECLCLSCKKDNPFQAPACCSLNDDRIAFDEDVCGGVEHCDRYTDEDKGDKVGKDYDSRLD